LGRTQLHAAGVHAFRICVAKLPEQFRVHQCELDSLQNSALDLIAVYPEPIATRALVTQRRAAVTPLTNHREATATAPASQEQNGDLCCDPDMEFRVDIEHRTAEALTFQMAIPPVYQRVYSDSGKVNVALRKALNEFLADWLRNCVAQGHRFGGGA
jgi:uncharacterized protein YqiB (DUF1249 family)